MSLSTTPMSVVTNIGCIIVAHTDEIIQPHFASFILHIKADCFYRNSFIHLKVWVVQIQFHLRRNETLVLHQIYSLQIFRIVVEMTGLHLLLSFFVIVIHQIKWEILLCCFSIIKIFTPSMWRVRRRRSKSVLFLSLLYYYVLQLYLKHNMTSKL